VGVKIGKQRKKRRGRKETVTVMWHVRRLDEETMKTTAKKKEVRFFKLLCPP
jgi:hypothetical protein